MLKPEPESSGSVDDHNELPVVAAAVEVSAAAMPVCASTVPVTTAAVPAAVVTSAVPAAAMPTAAVIVAPVPAAAVITAATIKSWRHGDPTARHARAVYVTVVSGSAATGG
jgi:hypothetical protein